MNRDKYRTFTTSVLSLFLVLLLGELLLHAAAQTITQEAPSQDARKVKTFVRPDYPELARELKIQGIVRLRTTVSADGKVLSVNDQKGNPVLVDAAVRAVKKWRYETAAKNTVEDVKLEFVL